MPGPSDKALYMSPEESAIRKLLASPKTSDELKDWIIQTQKEEVWQRTPVRDEDIKEPYTVPELGAITYD